MDVEAATREFVAALAAGDVPALRRLTADDAVFDMEGIPGRFAAAKTFALVARRAERLDLRVEAVQVKRNVGFAQVHLHRGAGAVGVLVLSWNQDHKVAQGTLHAKAFEWVAALAP
jgi:ketosteroid isomerase-like protein